MFANNTLIIDFIHASGDSIFGRHLLEYQGEYTEDVNINLLSYSHPNTRALTFEDTRGLTRFCFAEILCMLFPIKYLTKQHCTALWANL